VLVVDDDEDFRWLLTFLLSRDPTVTLVGIAVDGEAAVEFVRVERPGVVTMDVIVPRLGGLAATLQIKQEWPDTKVLIVTSRIDEDTPRVAFENGAEAVLSKRDVATALLPAIWLAVRT
jgi:two-component system, NarL family, invasion response regulator UvrY